MSDKVVLKQLQIIPGVGKSIAQDFYNLGIRKIADLKGKDPQRLYEDLCAYQGGYVDRCMLYVMRCAVYFASHEIHEKEKLKWWHWKD
jgi:hypothetical protein